MSRPRPRPTEKPVDSQSPTKPEDKPLPTGPRRIGLPAWLTAAFRTEQAMTDEERFVCDIAAGRFQ